MIPRTRAECVNGPRPCPHTDCRYHLAELAPRSAETCALDIAEQGDHGRAQLARVLNVSDDTLAAVESAARTKLAQRGEALGFAPSKVLSIEERLLAVLRRHGPLGRSAITEILGDVTDDAVTKWLTTMKKSGVVEQPQFNLWKLAGEAR